MYNSMASATRLSKPMPPSCCWLGWKSPCHIGDFQDKGRPYQVSQIMDLIAPDRWSHVSGFKNPANCASRGLFPSELLNHELWWSGPEWLYLPSSDWPKQPSGQKSESCDEEISLHVATHLKVPMDRYSSFTRLKRVTAWMFRFINHCCTPSKRQSVSQRN